MTDLKIYAADVEPQALQQINRSLESPAFEDAVVRIMPDVHAGKGSVIGFTAHVTNGRIIPNVVGVDIGCGMHLTPLGDQNIDLEAIDQFITNSIPSGRKVYGSVDDGARDFSRSIIRRLRCYSHLKEIEWLENSIATLGGGNHFIEIDRDDDGNHWLIVHSGSRNLGKQVAEYYQKLAIKRTGSKSRGARQEALAAELKSQGREREIQQELKKIRLPRKSDDDLAYLEGWDAEDYLHDMMLCVKFAMRSREYISLRIKWNTGLTDTVKGYRGQHVVHNYIECLPDGSFIIRKGAISAKAGETVLIPLNMQSGCILGKGKGNPDWNMSAPHGAGRVGSRAEAFRTLSMDEFRDRMQGIYSTSVCPETLDESPMAYKDPEYILSLLGDTVDDIRILRPVYNFKAHQAENYERRKDWDKERKAV